MKKQGKIIFVSIFLALVAVVIDELVLTPTSDIKFFTWINFVWLALYFAVVWAFLSIRGRKPTKTDMEK